MLVGVGDFETGEISMANAGHFNPLVVSGSGATFVETLVGLPLGVEPSEYRSTSMNLRSGSTLIVYTDGLVERRGENIDMGLQRLSGVASNVEADLDEFVSKLISGLGHDGHDDIAVLAIRWTDPN